MNVLFDAIFELILNYPVGLKSQLQADHNCTVIRDAQMEQIVFADVVVGDVVCIKYG